MSDVFDITSTTPNNVIEITSPTSNNFIEIDAKSENQLIGSVDTGVIRVPPAQSMVEKAVDEYMTENKQTIVDEIINAVKNSTTAAKIGEVYLPAAAWVGENRRYHQVVSIEGVTEFSQVDLTPNIEQVLTFYEKDLTFVTENEDGVVTVYAVGQKPANDYIIQVTITEVDV